MAANKQLVATVSVILMSTASLCSVTKAAESGAAVALREAAVVKLMPQCPTSHNSWSNPSASSPEAGFLLPIISALAVPAVEKGIAFAADWLKRYQNELSATTSARDVSTMYLIDDGKLFARNGCLVFFRGQLGPQAEFDKRVRAGTIGKDEVWTVDRLRFLRDGWKNERAAEEGDARRGRIAVVNTPLVYAEFALRYNDTKNATQFTLRPVFLDYRATAAERVGNANKDIVFTITFDYNEGATSTVFAKYDIIIPKTAVGSRYDAEILSDLVGRTQSLPPPHRSSKDDRALDVTPINVLLTMLETEKAGDLERLVSEAVNENKDKIGSAIASQIQKLLAPKDSAK